jgi:Ca-activated chloride channel family protein
MSFGSPGFLLFLLLLPVLVAGFVLLERRRDRGVAEWTNPALVPNLVTRQPGRRRYVPFALFLVGLALLLVGFARPQAMLNGEREGATVVLTIDVSRSMEATDVKPSRLRAARTAALAFLDKLPEKYRVSVVTFSDHITVAVPPTYDRDRVRRVLAFSPAGEGTALSDAAIRSVTVAARAVGRKKGPRPPSAVVMISDGAQTQGQSTPQQAVQRARRLGVPIYTVSLGTPNGVVERKLPGGFTERIAVPPDPRTLLAIARGSGGRFYRIQSAARLKQVYADLGSRVAHQKRKREVTVAAAGGALAFVLAGAFLSGAWFRRIV